MATIAQLGHGFVKGRFLFGHLDSNDVGLEPDAIPMSGEIILTPSTSFIRVASASPDPLTVMMGTIRVPLDAEGYVSWNGVRNVALWATDDTDGSPYNWTWRVDFALAHSNVAVAYPSFSFSLPTGATIDLTTQAPLTNPSPGVVTIRGPKGDDGDPANVWMGYESEYEALPASLKGLPNRAYLLFEDVAAPPGPAHEWLALFTQADGAPAPLLDTGQQWVERSPAGQTWSVASGRMIGSADGALRLVNLAQPDQRVGIRVGGTMHATNSFPTIVLRLNPAQTLNQEHHYRVQPTGTGVVSVYLRIPGQSVLWTSPAGVWDLSKELDAEAYNDKQTINGVLTDVVVIKVRVDGTEITPVGGVIHSGNVRPSGNYAGVRYGAGGGGATFGFDEFWAELS